MQRKSEVAPVVEALKSIGYQGWISAEVRPRPDSETAMTQTLASYRKWFGN